MALKIYTYKNCDACRKAIKWLKNQNLEFTQIPIRETPPSQSEFKIALASGFELKQLFNRSGRDYRELNLKDKITEMSEGDAIALLSSNGNLVKRPFLVSDQGILVGFREADWEKFESIKCHQK